MDLVDGLLQCFSGSHVISPAGPPVSSTDLLPGGRGHPSSLSTLAYFWWQQQDLHNRVVYLPVWYSSTYNKIHHVELPSLGSKTRNKKLLCSLAPFKMTLYSSRSGISPSRFHFIINSHWGIHFPSLNSLASLLAICTSVYNWRLLLELHQYLQTHKLACNTNIPQGSYVIGVIFHPSWVMMPSSGMLRVISLFWKTTFNDLSHFAKWLKCCFTACMWSSNKSAAISLQSSV